MSKVHQMFWKQAEKTEEEEEEEFHGDENKLIAPLLIDLEHLPPAEDEIPTEFFEAIDKYAREQAQVRRKLKRTCLRWISDPTSFSTPELLSLLSSLEANPQILGELRKAIERKPALKNPRGITLQITLGG